MEEKKPLVRVIPTIIRFLLSVFVIYKIYGETGLWTTVFASAVYISLEFQSILNLIQFRSLAIFMEKTLGKFEMYERIFKTKSQQEMVEDEILRRSKEN